MIKALPMPALCQCEECFRWTWLTVMIHEPCAGNMIAVLCLKCLSRVQRVSRASEDS